MHHCVAVCHFNTSVFIYCCHYYFVLCISYNNWDVLLIIVLMSGFLNLCFIGKGVLKSHSWQSVLLYVGPWRHHSIENLKKKPEKNRRAFLVIQYAYFLVHTFYVMCFISTNHIICSFCLSFFPLFVHVERNVWQLCK